MLSSQSDHLYESVSDVLKIKYAYNLWDHEKPLNLFTEFFSYMSTNIEPKELEIILRFSNLDTFKLAVDGDQLVNALMPIKKMPVSQNVFIRIEMGGHPPRLGYSFKIWRHIIKAYRGRIKEIRELVMPDSLRPKYETEKEKVCNLGYTSLTSHIILTS